MPAAIRAGGMLVQLVVLAWLNGAGGPSLLDRLTKWDGLFYSEIASAGYPRRITIAPDGSLTEGMEFAFHPLFPRSCRCHAPAGRAGARCCRAGRTCRRLGCCRGHPPADEIPARYSPGGSTCRGLAGRVAGVDHIADGVCGVALPGAGRIRGALRPAGVDGGSQLGSRSQLGSPVRPHWSSR